MHLRVVVAVNSLVGMGVGEYESAGMGAGDGWHM